MSFLDKLLGRLENKTVNLTSDYFWDAILVYCRNQDPTVRMAALTAAKKASREQRASMINHLQSFAVNEEQNLSFALNELADEIAVRDWTIRDAVAQGARLAELDEEYAIALDRFDAGVFRLRFPDVFD